MSIKLLLSLFVLSIFIQSSTALNIISKAQWGGRAPTSRSNLANGLSYAVIHHTAGAYCKTQSACAQQLRNIQDYHQKTLGWADIGYNFLIGGDGTVYEGRGWNTLGAHASNWNSKSIGISYLGNYNNDKPNAAQITATKQLLDLAIERGQIKSTYILYGHRQVGSTECPGNNLYNEIRNWPNWRAI